MKRSFCNGEDLPARSQICQPRGRNWYNLVAVSNRKVQTWPNIITIREPECGVLGDAGIKAYVSPIYFMYYEF